MAYLLVTNPSSGAPEDGLSDRAVRELPDVRVIELGPDVDLAGEIATGFHEGRVAVACGGDGTVNALAQHLAGTEGLMGVLPRGTLNHFARDLGVGDPETALSTLAEGREISVDVGRCGDRVFVNNLGLGVYPEVVRERERRERRLGKWPALAVSAIRVMIDFDPLIGEIAADGDRRSFVATAVFVGNNRFSTELNSVGHRHRLDAGVLDVRILRATADMRGRAETGFLMATSRRRVVRTEATRVDIALASGPRPVAFDGEQGSDRSHLSVSIDAAALRVLAPAQVPGTETT